ncbi:hypothetical protein RJ639_031120 [Escallonia herrerae]|uniref:Uncharacterized protein n=1 Tax=Escallonia herrerae TaxID=1293975 RepID=A0AA88X226_9ASTE|nr:hypothetical protein RJ639_031120 [Escallonia herrerae]
MAVALAAPSAFLCRIPLDFGKSTSGQYIHGTARTSRVKALFWGPKKAAEPPEMDYLLKDFVLTEFPLKEGSPNADKVKKISVSVVSSILEVSPKDWDACKLDAVCPGNFNPFLTHGFLSSLEESGSAVKETGWIPRHIIARDECENILGVVPLYLKRFDICYAVPRLELLYMLVWAHLFNLACSHSYGEFVFDHSWADAYYSYGARYYPKLQCSVPFTPVTGQRILVRNTPIKDQVFDFLVSAMKDLAVKVSSLHITFPSASEWHRLKEKGFLQRTGMQYHWKNRNYKNFDEFLMDMKQSKRKNIRQERKKISTQNLTMKRLRGYEIKARHWDAFYDFYRNTTDNKWGSAYLTREFFHIMGSKLGDHILLVAAEEGDELVAGALNLIGGDAIFGRLWGCLPRAYYPSLHFEACYYQELSSTESPEKKSLARLDQGYSSVCLSSIIMSQAIEAAIELNLSTVEAGAQGEHKIQRGYLPVTTYSCHYILDEGFREVIDNFLVRETAQVKMVVKLLQESGPFKDGIH